MLAVPLWPVVLSPRVILGVCSWMVAFPGQAPRRKSLDKAQGDFVLQEVAASLPLHTCQLCSD